MNRRRMLAATLIAAMALPALPWCSVFEDVLQGEPASSACCEAPLSQHHERAPDPAVSCCCQHHPAVSSSESHTVDLLQVANCLASSRAYDKDPYQTPTVRVVKHFHQVLHCVWRC